jgi:hypothetical protein
LTSKMVASGSTSFSILLPPAVGLTTILTGIAKLTRGWAVWDEVRPVQQQSADNTNHKNNFDLLWL